MFQDVTPRVAYRFTEVLRAAVTAACICALMISADATAPQLNTQEPGFYRMMLGDFEITALSDGFFDLQTNEMLANKTPAALHDLPGQSFLKDAVPTSVNAYLVNTGQQLILIDTGAAKLFGPMLGHLLSNLIASGYRPEQIDTILITHLHPDHIGGLVAEGKRVFPNATVRVDRRDADFWLSPSALAKAPADRQGFFKGTAASIGPYADLGRFQRFVAPTDLLPGIRAIPAPGHTPGHTMYSIESKGQKLIRWGDLMEIASVQFSQPSVTIVFDRDAPQAALERGKAHADAAQGG